jgi:hypothetical protein
MTEYQIEMHRAPGISDEERRRRLHRAYQILLDAARRAGKQDQQIKEKSAVKVKTQKGSKNEP